MKRQALSAVTAAALILFAGAVGTARADDDQKDNTETQYVEIESNAEKAPRAKFVDFAGTFEMPLASLEDLGSRIDKARLDADPIEMVFAAQLLKSAEQISGKQADLTSEQLMAEAVELVKRRSVATELQTVANLVGGEQAADLREQATAVAEAAAEESESSRDLWGHLAVANHTRDSLHVYANGREIGLIHPHGVGHFHVHSVHYLTARDHFGHRWHIHIPGHRHHYRWTIHPFHYPHHHGGHHHP